MRGPGFSPGPRILSVLRYPGGGSRRSLPVGFSPETGVQRPFQPGDEPLHGKARQQGSENGPLPGTHDLSLKEEQACQALFSTLAPPPALCYPERDTEVRP